MAIAIVSGQSGSAGGPASTTSTVTYTSTPTQNNLLVAMANVRGDVTPTVIPSGWAQSVTANGSGNDTYIFWKIAGASESTTHQWTWSGSFKTVMVWSEFSGITTTSPVDKTNSNTATSGSASTGTTGTLSQAEELVISAFGGDTNGTFSAYSSGTEVAQTSSTGGSTATRNTGAMVYEIVSATTAKNITATWSASTKVWAAAITTFKAPAASFAASQTAFRFYEDGTESGSTATANQDTNISRDVTSDTNLGLRIRLQETGGSAGATTDDYQLQYRVNAGSWTNTGTGAVTNFNSGSLTDGAATTNRLGAGSGSFVAGEISEDGLVDDHQITASNYTEYLYSITLASASTSSGDSIEFRVLRNGSTITYSITPTITVTKTVSQERSDSTEISSSETYEFPTIAVSDTTIDDSTEISVTEVGDAQQGTTTQEDDDPTEISLSELSEIIVIIDNDSTELALSAGDAATERFTFEAGTHGNSIGTTDDVGGGTLDGGNTGDGTAEYSNLHPHSGSLGMEITLSSTSQVHRWVRVAGSDTNTAYLSWYMYMPSGNSPMDAGVAIARWFDDANVNIAQVFISTGEVVSIRDNTSNTGSGTFDFSPYWDTMVRFDWYTSGSNGAGEQTLYMYSGANLESINTANASESITGGSITGAAGSYYRLGTGSVMPSSFVEYWDDIGWSLTENPGPTAAPGEQSVIAIDPHVPNFKQSLRNDIVAGTSAATTFDTTPTSGNLLLVATAIDKNAGTITPPSGFTTIYSSDDDDVSMYYGYKVSNGTEDTITTTWSTSTTAPNSQFIAELESPNETGTWQLLDSASNTNVDTQVTSWASGTTSSLAEDGRSVAVFGIDSSNNWTSGTAFTNGYLIESDIASSSTRADLVVGTLAEPSGSSATTTWSFTGTGDEISGAIAVFNKSGGGATSKSSDDQVQITLTSSGDTNYREIAGSDSTQITGVEGPGTGGSDNADEVEYFEFGVDGDAIGATSGIFDEGSSAGSATLKIDDAWKVHGTRSAIMEVPSGGWIERVIDLGSNYNLMHYRLYVRLETTNVSGSNVYLARALRQDDYVSARLNINTSEDLRMQDHFTGVGTGINLTTEGLFDTDMRIEWKFDVSNSLQTMELYVGSNIEGSTPDYTDSGTFSDTGVGKLALGSSITTTNDYIFHFDSLGWRNSDWCGPVGSGTAGEVVIDPGGPTVVNKDDTTQITGTSSGEITYKEIAGTDSTLITGTSLSVDFAKTSSDSTLITGTDQSTNFDKSASDSTLVTGTESPIGSGGTTGNLFNWSPSGTGAITTGNSPWDSVLGGSWNYDETGLTSRGLSPTAAKGTTQGTSASFKEAVTASDVVYTRHYAKFDAYESALNAYITFFRASGASSVGTIRVITGGGFSIRNTAGTQIGSTSPNVTTGQWVRIEAMWDFTNQLAELRLYTSDPHGTTADFTTSGGLTIAGQIDAVQFGYTGTVPSGNDFYVDEVAISNQGWIGPAGSGGQLDVTFTNTDSTQVSSSETSSFAQVNFSSTDTTQVTGTDASTEFAKDSSDSTQITGDSATTDFAKTSGDTTDITVTEQYQFATVDVSDDDPTEFGLTESTDLFNDLPGSDQTQITGISETVDITISGEVPISSDDTVQISLTSESTNFDKSTNDSTQITGTSLSTNFDKSTGDTTTLTGVDSGQLTYKEINASDSTLVTLTDATTRFDKTASDSTVITGTSAGDTNYLEISGTDSTEIGGGGASFSDDFNRADGTLGPNWSAPSATISTNQFVSNAPQDRISYWTTPTDTYDCYAEATLAGTSLGATGLFVRGDGEVAATADGYQGWWNTTTGGQIDKVENGSRTTLGTSFTTADTQIGDRIRLEAQGDTITLYLNDEVVAQRVDPSPIYPGKYVGLFTSNSANRFDDFAGGDLGGEIETSQIDISLTRADATQITSSEISSFDTIDVSDDDPTELTVTESVDQFNDLPGSDQTQITGTSDTVDIIISGEVPIESDDTVQIVVLSQSVNFDKSTNDATELAVADSGEFTYKEINASDSTSITSLDATTEFGKDSADSTIITGTDSSTDFAKGSSDTTTITGLSTSTHFDKSADDSTIITLIDASVNFDKSTSDSTEIIVDEVGNAVPEVPGNDTTLITVAEAGAWEDVSTGIAYPEGTDDTQISSAESGSVDYIELTGSDTTQISISEAYSFGTQDISGSDSTIITSTEAFSFGTVVVNAVDIDISISITEASSFDTVDVTGSDSTLVTVIDVSTNMDKSTSDSTILAGDSESTSIEAQFTGTDSTEISSSETSDFATVDVVGTDSTLVTGTSISLSSNLTPGDDTTTLSVTEGHDIIASGSDARDGTDSTEILSTDAGQITGIELSGSDSAEISVTESYQFATVSVSSNDDCDINVIEAYVFSDVNVSDTDSTEISTEEQYVFEDVALTGDDSTEISSDESGLADSGGADGSDDTEISTEEISLVDVTLEAYDQAEITTQEEYAFDTIVVSGSDSTEIDDAENAVVYNELPGTDQTDISSTETSDIEITGQIDKSAADDTVISSGETSNIEIFGLVEKGASDSTEIGSTESSSTTALISTSDITNITTTEGRSFGIISISSSDQTLIFFQSNFNFGPVDETTEETTEISVVDVGTIVVFQAGQDDTLVSSSESSTNTILTFLEYDSDDTTEIELVDSSENLLGVSSSDATEIQGSDNETVLASNPNPIRTDVAPAHGVVIETSTETAIKEISTEVDIG